MSDLAKTTDEWNQQVKGMRNESAKIDWSKTDWSKLNPKDVGVMFGPPMTEEQFEAYRKNKKVTVLRGPHK